MKVICKKCGMEQIIEDTRVFEVAEWLLVHGKTGCNAKINDVKVE